MPERSSFDYAVIRIVPRVERGEFLNAGVILFCRQCRFLAARTQLDAARLAAFAPDLAPEPIASALDAITAICDGAESAGPIARLGQAERFHWLVSPSSTVVETSPVHSGLCDDPARALDDLFERLVRFPPPNAQP